MLTALSVRVTTADVPLSPTPPMMSGPGERNEGLRVHVGGGGSHTPPPPWPLDDDDDDDDDDA